MILHKLHYFPIIANIDVLDLEAIGYFLVWATLHTNHYLVSVVNI